MCFAGVNSKMRDLVRKKRKIAIAVASVAIEFGVSRQKSKKMVGELCQNNFFCVATQDLKINR